MRKKSVRTSILIAMILCLHSFQQLSWSGPLLSDGDIAFLEKLKASESVNMSLGVAATFRVGDVLFPVDRAVVARSSRYFFTRLTEYSDARVIRSSEPGKQVVDSSPLDIKDTEGNDLDPDIFTKVLRLMVDKSFEPFSSGDEHGAHTLALLQLMEYFELTDLSPVLDAQVLTDGDGLGRVVEIVSAIEGGALPVNGQVLLGNLRSKVMSFVRGKPRGGFSAAGILSLVSPERLFDWIPGLKQLLQPAASGVAQACPDGYVRVPGDPVFDTQDFCVMKYTASRSGNAAVSRLVTAEAPAAAQWVNIPRTDSTKPIDAERACAANGDHLITNAEWMTVARNIEANPDNWSGHEVGNGVLSRGNSASQAALLPLADLPESNQFVAGNSNDWTHTRTHKISTPEGVGIIWDFAGNLWQWIADDLQTGRENEWKEFNNPIITAALRLLYGPANPQFSSAQNMGKIYLWDAGAALRGGSWISETGAGVFAANLYGTPVSVSPNVSFRCVLGLNE